LIWEVNFFVKIISKLVVSFSWIVLWMDWWRMLFLSLSLSLSPPPSLPLFPLPPHLPVFKDYTFKIIFYCTRNSVQIEDFTKLLLYMAREKYQIRNSEQNAKPSELHLISQPRLCWKFLKQKMEFFHRKTFCAQLASYQELKQILF